MQQGDKLPASAPPSTPEHQLAPFRELLHSLCGKLRQGLSPQDSLPPHTMEAVDRMSGTELRDHLLAIDPLDHLWVARVNQVCSEHCITAPSMAPKEPVGVVLLLLLLLVLLLLLLVLLLLLLPPPPQLLLQCACVM